MSNKNDSEKEILIKQLSQNLEDLERFLRDLWHFLPLPLCYVNPLGIILEANFALGEFFKKNPEELIGEKVEIIFLDKKKAKSLHQKIFKEKKISEEVEIVLEKEEEKIVKVSATAREDEKGNIIGYYLAFSDITELKTFQVELEKRVTQRTKEIEKKKEEIEGSRKALLNILEDVEKERKVAEEEEEKTRAIIDNFVDGLLFFDKERILRVVNPKARLLFKSLEIDQKELLNKSIDKFKNLPYFGKIFKEVDEKEKISKKEIYLKGEQVFELTSLTVIRGKEKLGKLVILHDITREKRVEKLKSEFVSLAAHQLRTPLSGIKWTLRMLLDGDLGPLNKDQLDLLEKTYQSNERMIDLINDLLNVTRIEEGKFLSKFSPIQLEDLCQKITDSQREEISKKEIDFGLILPKKKLPLIMGDVEKIELVVRNLLDNAIKYTKKGGKVIISLRKINNKIEFKIEDNGVGIPKDQQERVFTKFFRGANIVKLETSGTGLGLFIAKNIIKAHQGKIWFESEENKGSKFYFTLPIKQ
jgi:PAS domain S-box-containing protein